MEHQKENASFKHVNSTLTEKTRCFEEWIRNRSEFCSKRIQLQQIPSDIESRGLCRYFGSSTKIALSLFSILITLL